MSSWGGRNRLPAFAILVIAGLAASCHGEPPENAISNLLIILPNGIDVQHKRHQVSYRLAEPYPGTSTINALADAMARQGCQPTEKAPLNRERGLINRRWEEWNKKGGGVAKVWMGAWACDRGDIVTYALSVDDPGSRAGTPLGVAGSYLSASQVRAIRRETHRVFGD